MVVGRYGDPGGDPRLSLSGGVRCAAPWGRAAGRISLLPPPDSPRSAGGFTHEPCVQGISLLSRFRRGLTIVAHRPHAQPQAHIQHTQWVEEHGARIVTLVTRNAEWHCSEISHPQPRARPRAMECSSSCAAPAHRDTRELRRRASRLRQHHLPPAMCTCVSRPSHRPRQSAHEGTHRVTSSRGEGFLVELGLGRHQGYLHRTRLLLHDCIWLRRRVALSAGRA